LRILVTGCRGMLGSDIANLFSARHEVRGADIHEFDICDINQTDSFFSSFKPDAVIHCAAFTSVDECETFSEKAFSVNSEGTRNIGLCCEKHGAKLVYISTDYVFDGRARAPYHEYDQPSPIGVYGMSKYYGERYAEKTCRKSFIVRTSWLFGKNGHNFVKAIQKQLSENRKLAVVVDQWGSPTYTIDLAAFLLELVNTEKYGIYHATNEGFCNWLDFASAIASFSGAGRIEITGITSDKLTRKASRPLNSMLYKTSIISSGLNLLPEWEDALKRYLNS